MAIASGQSNVAQFVRVTNGSFFVGQLVRAQNERRIQCLPATGTPCQDERADDGTLGPRFERRLDRIPNPSESHAGNRLPATFGPDNAREGERTPMPQSETVQLD